MLPWFQDRFPLYLAPMAGITDTNFRQLCKGYGADVMVSEFVSAEGIFRRQRDLQQQRRCGEWRLCGRAAAHSPSMQEKSVA